MKTTISPPDDVHALVVRLKNISGLSLTGIYTLGALHLVAQHAGALEHGSKRHLLLEEMKTAFTREIERKGEGDEDNSL